MKRSGLILFLISVFLASGCSPTLKQGVVNQKSDIKEQNILPRLISIEAA